MLTAPADPIEAIADSGQLRVMLNEAVERTRILRSLLKLSERRKAHQAPAILIPTVQPTVNTPSVTDAPGR